MRPFHTRALGGAARHRLVVFSMAIGIAAPALSAGCSTPPARTPATPLVTGEPAWPEDVARDAARLDRLCQAREAKLQAEYREGKEEQEGFKTLMGSISGAVGTAGGVVTGVGSYVIDSPTPRRRSRA